MCTLARLASADGEPAPAPLLSDSDRARAHEAYEQGKAAFEARDYLRAAKLFLDAYRLAPRHDPLWNAARALDLGGEPARAANLYSRYLDEAPPEAKDRDRATAARKELAARLGRLEVQARGVTDVRLDGAPLEGTSVYVAPGEHVVVGRAGEAEVRARPTVAAGEAAGVVLEPPAAAPPQVAATVPPPRGARVLPRGVVWIGAGVTAVLAGVTVASGVDTLAAKRRYDAAPSGGLLDDGRAKETRTNALFWSSLAAGALTGVAAIWLVDWSAGASPARVRARLGPTAATLEGTFW